MSLFSFSPVIIIIIHIIAIIHIIIIIITWIDLYVPALNMALDTDGMWTAIHSLSSNAFLEIQYI